MLIQFSKISNKSSERAHSLSYIKSTILLDFLNILIALIHNLNLMSTSDYLIINTWKENDHCGSRKYYSIFFLNSDVCKK